METKFKPGDKVVIKSAKSIENVIVNDSDILTGYVKTESGYYLLSEAEEYKPFKYWFDKNTYAIISACVIVCLMSLAAAFVAAKQREDNRIMYERLLKERDSINHKNTINHILDSTYISKMPEYRSEYNEIYARQLMDSEQMSEESNYQNVFKKK